MTNGGIKFTSGHKSAASSRERLMVKTGLQYTDYLKNAIEDEKKYIKHLVVL